MYLCLFKAHIPFRLYHHLQSDKMDLTDQDLSNMAHLVNLISLVRHDQTEYFRTKDKNALLNSKRRERDLDKFMRENDTITKLKKHCDQLPF